MRKAALLILSSLFSFLLFSQQKVFTYSNPDLSASGFYSTSLVSEENDGFLLSLINRWSVKRILINKEGRSVNLLQQFSLHKDSSSDFKYNSILPGNLKTFYQKNSFVGGSYHNRQITEILRNKVSYDFIFLETNLSNGEILAIDTAKSSSSEKIISCIKKENKLYLLSYIESTNNLVVYEKESQKVFSKTILTITIDGFGKISNSPFAGNIKEFSDIFNKKNFAVYENNLRYPVLFTSIRNKAYIQKNQVIFTVTSNSLDTYLIAINLDKITYTIKSFDQDSVETKNPGRATTSSLLIDSLLITCHASEKILHLAIFNTSSQKVINSYKIDKTNISSVSTQPIIKTGSFFSNSDARKENFEKFYKTAAANELSISGYIDQEKLYLSFAAPYKQFINGSTLLSVVTSLAGTYFINSSPNNYGYLLTTFKGVKTPTFVGFDATLDMKDYTFISQNPNFTVWDKITSFITAHKLNLDSCLFFYLNNYYYIGYIFPETDRYMIYRFSEKGIEE